MYLNIDDRPELSVWVIRTNRGMDIGSCILVDGIPVSCTRLARLLCCSEIIVKEFLGGYHTVRTRESEPMSFFREADEICMDIRLTALEQYCGYPF